MNRTLKQQLATVAAVLLSAAFCHAAPSNDTADLVKASLVADVDAAAPGRPFMLGVRLKMKPHWHTYWVNPGETGEATKVTLTGPRGFEFGEVQWPLPSKIAAPGGFSYGYEGEVLLLIPVTVSADVATTGEAALAADVRWLSCKETCVEGGAKLTLSLPLAASPRPANRELFDTWLRRLPTSKDAAATSEKLSAVAQPKTENGQPAPALLVRWKEAPKKVEWFPVSTRAVAVEKVVVRHDGAVTRIEFKPTVYKPDQVPGGRVDSVLVYEGPDGLRRGVSVPIMVPVPQ
jgi:DsbC/DsbD-like thiol-disulfide interchange protein